VKLSAKALGALIPVPVAGTWWRAVQLRHVPTPLAYSHTAVNPGRFNAGTPAHPGVEVLYLTEDLLTASFEVQALIGSPLPGHTFLPNPLAVGWSFLPVVVILRAVADLTNPTELATVDTSVQELTGDWRGYALRSPVLPPRPPHSDAPTHRLGHALDGTGRFEALLTYSAKVPTRRNLVVFPQRLTGRGSVTWVDPATNTTHAVGLGGAITP
jgi:RES domain-containing protein